MTDYRKMAFSLIRQYLWTNLLDSGVLDENDYWVETMGTRLNPIIPSQQVPEFQNLLPGVPYMVYDIEMVEYGDDFWITEEVATLTIVGGDYTKLYQISQLIKDLMQRYDMSAREINDDNPDSPFKFLKAHVSGMVSPDIGSESDVQTATVELTYCYTRDLGAGMRML